MQFSPCIRGHLTERQEQKLHKSPGLGLRMFTPATRPIPSRGLCVACATDNCSVARYILDRLKDHPEASELMICEGVALSVATQSIATRSIGTPWWRFQPKPLTEPHEG